MSSTGFGIQKKGTRNASAERQRGLLATFWAAVAGSRNRAGLYEKSGYGLWAETLNPLRGIKEQQLQNIFDQARRGVYARLTYIYNEIEAADPLLLTVAERREAAIGACDWKIVPVSEKRTAGFDEVLAEEQAHALELAYGAASDHIDTLAEHLGSAFFRGFAHARPLFGAEGELAGFECYDAWNFAFDKLNLQWWWNPDATDMPNASFAPIPAGELISLVPRRHIDYPALAIYIRAALGERRYGMWLERYGIPPVTIIMPEFAEKGEEGKYFDAAEKLSRAGSGALPYGSAVNYATEARGTNPFLEFLRHQQELITIMATGGTLGTLASPTGIGSGASEIQDKTWRGIVKRDVRAAGRAINRILTPRLLAREFPGRPVLAHFEFEAEETPTAKQVFEEAGAAKTAGYLVEKEQLEAATGYSLVALPEGGGFGGGNYSGSGGFGAIHNKSEPWKRQTPLQNAGIALQNADQEKGGAKGGPGGEAAGGDFEGIGGVALEAALKVLEEGGSPEAALEAYDAAARVELRESAGGGATERLAEQIAAGMVEEVDDIFGAVVANRGTSDGARKGWETRRRNGWTPQQLAENKQKVGDLAKEALDDTQSNRTVSLGRLEGQVVEDIKAVTGIDVSGYEQTISSSEIRHTNKNHGPVHTIRGKTFGETAPDQVPFERDDYGRIPDIYSSYDHITRGTPEKNTGYPTVRLHKQYPDGKLVGVEVIVTQEKELRYKTGWKKAP